MHHTNRTRRRLPCWLQSRRGVVSVLAMMMLVLFGSLVAAMAIASQGNIRTASTHRHVMRAAGAAETGLAIAQVRLAESASRFLVSTSDMDSATVTALWLGNTGGLGDITVLDPPNGQAEGSTPAGIAEAVALIHAADENIIIDGFGIAAPTIGAAPAGVDLSIYQADGWVYTPIVALEALPDTGTITQPAYQIVYAPLANGIDIRAIVTGYDFAYQRNGQPLTRTIMQDSRMVKRVNHAVISPSRIMIGKNVHITGDLGVRYTDVGVSNGNPLLLKSDFADIDPILDDKLDDFYEAIVLFDVDGDNRLRVSHPIESQGISTATGADYGGSVDDTPFADVTGDGYVDEFDIFIIHYDEDGDGRVALSDALRAGTPGAGATAEFVDGNGLPIDDDLALLIDSNTPDRNRNGEYGFEDLDGNGMWDPATETLNDFDAANSIYRDQELGYRDGFIDAMDRYTKIQGTLAFSVTESAWSAAQGDYQSNLRGAIRPDLGSSPISFEVPDANLPLFTAANFADSENELQAAADGVDFWQQVADNLGIGLGDLATYDELNPPDGVTPRLLRLDPDLDGDQLPDNWATAYFEKMPFNSPAHADWYYRPVFENMVFLDAQIPQGVNGLFVNCTFAGVTWVRTEPDNTHPHYTLYGKLEFDEAQGVPMPERDRRVYGDDAGETAADAPPMLPASAVPPEQLILLANDPLDKGDVLASEIASFDPTEYTTLPDPLVVNGARITDTKTISNNLRFHDCLFVGSIVSDTPASYTHVRNKIQFTGKTRFATEHPLTPNDPLVNPEEDDLEAIAKSSMMLPNYSVDIGSFNSPPEQNVRLFGAIIAGVLDIRGNASIDGALLLTFEPVLGSGPLVDIGGNPVGNPAGFNTTLGYFGPDDGDGESLDPRQLPIFNGVRIAGWDVDGDGLSDVNPDQPQPPGSTPVPFHGYGRIELRFDPLMTLPNGIMLPLQFDARHISYREGRL